MSDLIDRQAAIDALEREKSLVERPITETRWFDFGLRKAQDVLSELPSAQPERKTGIWILSDIQNKEDNDNGNYAYICSNCFHHDIQAKTAVVPYCWYCGAKMERGAENG